jgi:hypothetical protein
MACRAGNPQENPLVMKRFLAAALIAAAPAASADTLLSRAFTVKETGWVANFDMHRPKDTWNQTNRDITLMSLEGLRSWEFQYGLEAMAGGGVFIATGTRTDLGWAAPIKSDAYGVALGGGLRWYVFNLAGVRPFGDGFVNFAYTPTHPFPAGGSAVNGYLRAGGGVRYDISKQYALEAGFHLAHVSNGGGLVPGNPAYNGQGWFLNMRWRD